MIIKIDVRESELLQKITHLIETVPIFKDIIIKSEVLPIGDIIIADKNEEKLIIERKSMSDLLSSVKDGRYEEQSYRLNGSPYHNHNIIYLIEGETNNFNRFKTEHKLAIEKTTLYSAMFSLNYYKGFSIFRSFSLGESATIICNMAYKIKKSDKEPFYKNVKDIKDIKDIVKTVDAEDLEDLEDLEEIDEPSVKNYVNVVKKVKKENVTPENIGEIMLSQIPGVSSTIAITVMEKFKTLQNLIKELESNEDCLKDISSVNSKGQSRKINKTSVTNIVKFLLKK
jgi:ERCC4-type nuclease